MCISSRKIPVCLRTKPPEAREDGTIHLRVNPEVYEVNVSGLTNGLYLKSVKFGDTEVTDAGLDFSRGASPLARSPFC